MRCHAMSVRETEFFHPTVKDVQRCVDVGVPLVSAGLAHEHRLAFTVVVALVPTRIARQIGVVGRDLDDEDSTGWATLGSVETRPLGTDGWYSYGIADASGVPIGPLSVWDEQVFVPRAADRFSWRSAGPGFGRSEVARRAGEASLVLCRRDVAEGSVEPLGVPPLDP